MAQTRQIKPKYRIGNFESSIIFAIAFFLWGLMVLLSFTGIGEVGSEFIALCGSGLFASWFWVRGCYRDKAALQNLMCVLGGTIIDFIPFVNDAPIMVIEVASVIVITRLEDVRKAHEKARLAAATEVAQQKKQKNTQAAAIAASNANAMRQQAMAASVAAANDAQRHEAEERDEQERADNDNEEIDSRS